MSLKRTLVRNIASNWAGYAVQVAVAFFLTPFILHVLGETRYGVWSLAIGLTGYYGLLDLGFSAGVTQYLTRYLAAKDFDRLNRIASSGVVALTCCGTIVLIGSLVIAFNASTLFQIPAGTATELALVIVIMGAAVAMQFGFFTYSAVFTAVQRFDLSNGIGVATRILSAGVTVICLKSGYGLVGLSLVVAGTNLLDYLIRWRVAGRLLPAMKISLKLVNRESLREVVNFGIWNSVSAGSVRLISYTDALVIAAFMPVAAVAPFAIAANLRSYFDDVFVRVGFVFFPAVTELDARGNQVGLKQLYLTSSKFMFLGSILLGSIAMFSSRDFFRLWVGSFYAEPKDYSSIATIFYILIVASMISVAQRIGYQVLLGTRRVKLLALLFAAEGVSNLILSLTLVGSYGLVGIAIGTLIPAVLFQGLLQPVLVCQSLQITSRIYCREVLLRPILAAGAVGPLLVGLSSLTNSDDWMMLLFNASLSVGVAGPLVLLIGLAKTERELYLAGPITEARRFLGAVGVTRS
jgi:O-antigen/teichoic acid export membrane protein